MSEDARKDFFLSYTKADRAWAEWIAWQLEAAGYRTTIQAWDFRPGSNFVLEMQQAARLAARTIAVLSPDYLHSRFTQPEWAAAFAQDPTGEQGLLLPVRVRSCDLSGLLPQIIYLDLVDLEESEARTALLAGGQHTRAKPATAPRFPGRSTQQPPVPAPRFPGTLPSIWNVPFRRNPFFTGREALLAHLHEQLNDTKTAALTQTQAISGLGGIGKTQTAVEYAYRYQAEYHAVLWVTAATALSLLTDFVNLAAVLNLPEQDAQDQQVTVTVVKHWLETQTEWLLILDNADDVPMVTDFLPLRGNGHVLLTTRAQTIGPLGQSIEVEKMEQQEGLLLLLRRARVLSAGTGLETVAEAERNTAEAIVQVVDGLPLALDQAGAYIEETGCSLADYLRLYQTRARDLLGLRSFRTAEYPEPVTTTWSLSFQQVEQANPAAAALLRLCAFLAPDTIPEELLSEGAPELGEVLEPVAVDPFQLNAALEVVRRYSLLKRETKTKTLSIHRLVQAVLRDEMSPQEQRQWAERAVQAVSQVFPVADVETWARCERYLPHAQACAALISHYDLRFAEAAYLLHQTGYYLLDHARYSQAEQYYQQALQIYEYVLGSEHPSTATTLHELGRLALNRGQYAQAEQYFQRALQIKEKTLPPDHPSTIITLESYAFLLRQMHRAQEAALLEARIKGR